MISLWEGRKKNFGGENAGYQYFLLNPIPQP